MAYYYTETDDVDGNQEMDCFSVKTSSRTVRPVDTTRTMMASGEIDDDDMNHTPRYMNEFYGPGEVMVSQTGATTLRSDQYSICISSDTDSDIVPPLDLRSEMDLSIDGSIPTFSCHKAKLIHYNDPKSNQTYQLWLQKKMNAQLLEAARRKKDEERRQQEQEERRLLAEEKYRNWLAKKKQINALSQAKLQKQQNQAGIAGKTTRSSSSSSSSSSSASASASASSSSLSSASSSNTNTNTKRQSESLAEKQRKIEEWQRAKRKQVEERRLREKQEAEKRAKIEAKRKEESSVAYERWIQRNKNRPKPVPLNQGILSLRGTISDIYINPNEWQSIL